jgi:hypothetical protein
LCGAKLDGPDLRNCLKVRLQITTGTDHWVDFCWSVVDILTNEKRKLKGQTTKGLKFHQDLIYLNKTACMERVLVSKSKKKKKNHGKLLCGILFFILTTFMLIAFQQRVVVLFVSLRNR